MAKKLYYELDDGDSTYTCELFSCMDIIYGQMLDVKEADEEKPEYTLTPVWMTEQEYNELSEQ